MYHHIQIIAKVVITFHSKNKRLNIKDLGPQSTTFLPNCSLSLIKSYEEHVPGNFQTFIINIGTVYHGVLSQGSNYSDTGSDMRQWSTVKRSFQHHSQTCSLKDPGQKRVHTLHTCTHAHIAHMHTLHTCTWIFAYQQLTPVLQRFPMVK